jgi:hypothetical protein
MCLSSFFQFPLFIIACVEELETTNKTSSSTSPQDMLNGSSSTKTLPSPLFLLSCLFLVLAIILPISPQAFATALPITEADAAPHPHHRHTRPYAAWHRTTHVRRSNSNFPLITAGAELLDITFGNEDSATATDSGISTALHLRLPRPRDLLRRTYECWKGGKLWTCVMNMHVLKAGAEDDS